MAQDYHCIAIWHDKKWRREGEKKKEKENGKNKGEYGRKPWLKLPQTGRFPEKSPRLRRKLVPGSAVERSVLQ